MTSNHFIFADKTHRFASPFTNLNLNFKLTTTHFKPESCATVTIRWVAIIRMAAAAIWVATVYTARVAIPSTATRTTRPVATAAIDRPAATFPITATCAWSATTSTRTCIHITTSTIVDEGRAAAVSERQSLRQLKGRRWRKRLRQ